MKQFGEKRVPRDTRALNVFGLGSCGVRTMGYMVEEAKPLGLSRLIANAVGFDSHTPTVDEVSRALRPFSRKPRLNRLYWRSHSNIQVTQLPASPFGSAFGYGRMQTAFDEAQPFWFPKVQEEVEKAKAHAIKCGYKLAVTIKTGSFGGSHRNRLEGVIDSMLADTGFITSTTLSVTNVPARSDKLAYENLLRSVPEIPSRNDLTLVLDDNVAAVPESDRLAARVIDGLISANVADGTQPAITDVVNMFKHDGTQIVGLNVIENSNPIWRRRWTWTRRLDPDDGASDLFSQLKTVFSSNQIAKTSTFAPRGDDSTLVVLCMTPYSKATFRRVFKSAETTIGSARVVPLWAPTEDAKTTTALVYGVTNDEFSRLVGATSERVRI